MKIVLHLLIVWIFEVEGFTPFVSLTVEEEVSLVGEHCPGTVRLFCEGVDLTQLRWRYNGANRVYSFMTTDLPMSAVPSNPAFVHVQLINVTQTPSDPRFARFISVLTVDITQLHSQNIASINCGDSGTIATKQVSVIPRQPSVPNSPVITAVTATYMSDLLITLEASWMDLVEVNCLGFNTSLIYLLNLTSPLSSLAVVEVNQTSCKGGLCIGLVLNISRSLVEEYTLSLIARNDIGSSEETVYQIKQRNDQYYTPEIISTSSCQIVAQCVSANPNVHNASCSVSYGTDTSSLDTTTSPINTKFNLSTASSNSVFLFSLMVNSILRIDVIEESGITDTCEKGIGQLDIVAFGSGLIVLGLVLVLVLVPILVLIYQRKIRAHRVPRSTRKTVSDTVVQVISLEPKQALTDSEPSSTMEYTTPGQSKSEAESLKFKTDNPTEATSKATWERFTETRPP